MYGASKSRQCRVECVLVGEIAQQNVADDDLYTIHTYHNQRIIAVAMSFFSFGKIPDLLNACATQRPSLMIAREECRLSHLNYSQLYGARFRRYKPGDSQR